jgi:hypothetical protein
VLGLIAPSSPPPFSGPTLPVVCLCVSVCVCAQAAEAAVLGLSVSPGELKTETVEEFISISDGQVRGVFWLGQGVS